MKCQNCGNDFAEGVYCPECGTKIVAKPYSPNDIPAENTQKYIQNNNTQNANENASSAFSDDTKTSPVESEMTRLESIYNAHHSLKERLGEYRELKRIHFETEDVRAKVAVLENHLVFEVMETEKTSTQNMFTD